MSDRIRNNLIAGLIVFAFWCVFVIPVMAADPIVTDSTSVVTTIATIFFHIPFQIATECTYT